MITFFFDCRGPLLVDFLELGTTMNDSIMQTHCRNCDVPWSQMLSDRIILLHDNARPCTANVVTDKLQRFDWETLKHPLYSPDLSPCDFHTFGNLKKDFRGHRFYWTRKCKSGWGCGSVSNLSLSTRMEMIILSPTGFCMWGFRAREHLRSLAPVMNEYGW